MSLFPNEKILPLINEAYKEIGQGDSAKAVKTLVKALNIDPDSITARRYLAFAMVQVAQYVPALTQMQKLSKITPMNAFDWYVFGEAYAGAGALSHSQSCYQQALAISPAYHAARGGGPDRHRPGGQPRAPRRPHRPGAQRHPPRRRWVERRAGRGRRLRAGRARRAHRRAGVLPRLAHRRARHTQGAGHRDFRQPGAGRVAAVDDELAQRGHQRGAVGAQRRGWERGEAERSVRLSHPSPMRARMLLRFCF